MTIVDSRNTQSFRLVIKTWARISVFHLIFFLKHSECDLFCFFHTAFPFFLLHFFMNCGIILCRRRLIFGIFHDYVKVSLLLAIVTYPESGWFILFRIKFREFVSRYTNSVLLSHEIDYISNCEMSVRLMRTHRLRRGVNRWILSSMGGVNQSLESLCKASPASWGSIGGQVQTFWKAGRTRWVARG